MHRSHFEYLHYRKDHEKTMMHRDAHTISHYSPELQKKVTLLKHFRGYMQENLNKVCHSKPLVVKLNL